MITIDSIRSRASRVVIDSRVAIYNLSHFQISNLLKGKKKIMNEAFYSMIVRQVGRRFGYSGKVLGIAS